MDLDTRRNALVDLINSEGNISFANIHRHFPNVSEMTLRTDLKALDLERRIVRVHGGARSVDYVVGIDGLQDSKKTRNTEAKQLIAQKAATLIRPNSTVFFDSGTTTEELIAHMPDAHIQAFTCNVQNIVALAAKKKVQTFVIGGRLSPFTMCFNGSQTLKQLEQLSFDQSFVGVSAYQSNVGFTCGSDEEAAIKRCCVENAGQVIALFDSSKIDRRSTFHVCSLQDVDVVVSDGNLPKEFLDECRHADVEVL
ncbi:DeoR/GlpR family DNA-binding transcription regulator [uncultured Enorma sp.]|uniref:DeoR/GlpR family DNA-binding transcription regulator n=1 Tax=uncultured Enorma sp. TaxID=1714346 RepID=UPI002805455D|nr:DeoR/GlpR family DNA-binding transcription regulator [uncultured Enorma sp.]